MVNGTQVSLALALEGLFAFEDAFAAALVAGALSVEAALGSTVPFDERIHRARGQRGQADVAAVYRGLLEPSGFRAASAEAGRVQDPYSLRCQPQVLGAALDAMRFAADILDREVNAMTDNLAGIIAIELLAACQGVHLRRRLRSSSTLEGVVGRVHDAAPAFDEDRYFAPSIEAVKSLVVGGVLRPLLPAELFPTG